MNPSSRTGTTHAPSTPLPLGSIRPRGWLLRQLQIQAEGLSGHLDELWPDVGPESGWLGGPGENWERGPYYLDGLLPLAHLLQEQNLLDKVRPWVEWMLASRQPSGFFGPADNLDWWPRMVAVKVLIQHAEATGDDRVLPHLLAWFRFQLDHLADRPLTSWGRMRAADAALGVWWAHRRSGEDWLLELIDLLDAQTFDWESYLTRDLITGPCRIFEHRDHGPNVAMGLKKPAVDWLRDGDRRHFDQVEEAFAQLDRWHGQAHGWFSGDEWLGGRSANAGVETCQVVELMYTLETLSTLIGTGIHGDRLESVAYNLLPAAFDPLMRAHQYHQQCNQIAATVARRNWTYSSDDANVFGLEPHFGCCTANYHQGWPKLAASLWVRDHDEALRVVAWAPAQITTEVAGQQVVLEVETRYPVEEQIAVTVAAGDRPVLLRLRIPAWCEQFELMVDGERQRPDPVDGHVTVAASDGTRILLTLAMTPRPRRGDLQSVAVALGPLMMVLPLGERWIPMTDGVGMGEWEVRRTTSWNWALDPSAPQRWPIARTPAPELFGSRPGVALRVPAAKVPEWQGTEDEAGPVPSGPMVRRNSFEQITLVPYGNARLRICEFPAAATAQQLRTLAEA